MTAAFSKDLREQAVRALRELLDGLQAADRARGPRRLAEPPGERPQEIYAGLVAALMRMVLLLYAEGRGLTPAPGAGSLAALHAELRRDRRDGAPLEQRHAAWPRVVALLRVLSRPARLAGPRALDPTGALFDLDAFPFLEGRRRGDPTPGDDLEPPPLTDACVLRVLDALHLRQGEPLRYEDLDVEHIGSLYEGLTSAVLEVGAGGALRLQPGEQRRRAGSYYTPRALAREVVARALAPLLARARAPDDLLALRVCDPAMGSGAFLVEACRQLADALTDAWRRAGAAPAGPPGDDELTRARRLVAARCLHGVDLDPLAVDLARASLWLLAAAPEPPAAYLARRLRCGDSLLGAAFNDLDTYPAAAWRREAADPALRARLRALRRRCDVEAAASASAPAPAPAPAPGADELRRALDAWIALWFWPAADDLLAAAPTPASLNAYVRAAAADPAAVADPLDPRVHVALRIAGERRFLHWQIAFPEAFDRPDPGFDALLGNPPWVAYVGRAAQPIEPEVWNFLVRRSPAFHGFRSLHGAFVHRAASLLRPGGRLGLVVPTSISDLEGYEPVRRAHDALCAADPDLPDFGADAFEGVFLPCMALLSTRRGAPAPPPEGVAPSWPLARTDLDPVASGLLARLSSHPVLPPSLFGERGFQTTAADARLLHRIDGPAPPHLRPIREGTDIGEFIARPPRHLLDPAAVKGRFRTDDEWRTVRLLIRQTARFPIAALADGLPFRNSILAGFAGDGWSELALLCYLNASPIRWFHHARNRDARQGMPQVKIAHLRALPAPAPARAALIEHLDAMGRALGPANAGIACADRVGLDELVADLLDLTGEERRCVAAWRDNNPLPRSESASRPPAPPLP